MFGSLVRPVQFRSLSPFRSFGNPCRPPTPVSSHRKNRSRRWSPAPVAVLQSIEFFPLLSHINFLRFCLPKSPLSRFCWPNEVGKTINIASDTHFRGRFDYRKRVLSLPDSSNLSFSWQGVGANLSQTPPTGITVRTRQSRFRATLMGLYLVHIVMEYTISSASILSRTHHVFSTNTGDCP